jgi:hypothetical protein
MNRLHGAWLLLLLTSSGCLTALPDNKGDGKLASVLNFEYRNRTPVTADAITAENARDQAQALADELDRERNAEMLTPASPAPKR